MIRLLMGITLSETGGSQRVVYNIISNLPDSMYDITLVTSPGGELLDWVSDLNRTRINPIKVITPPCLKREISLVNDAKLFVFMMKLLAKNKYDIAHFHNSKIGIVGRLTARLAFVPRIYYTVHGWGLNPDTTGKLYGVMSLLERSAARVSTEVVFVSGRDMEDGIRNRWARKDASRLIYNGIPDENAGPMRIRGALGISSDLPVLAFVARLAEPKEPLFAIRVSRRLADMGQDHRFLIIGDGPMYADCEKLAEELDVRGTVVLMGQRSDVRAILREADVFCLFSRWEGLPVSIIEAMFAALPVVASGVGGVSELVEHGKTGFVLESFDVGQAAEAISALIKDKKLRKSLGAAGRAAATQRFTAQRMAEAYRQLYEMKQAN